jgi:hypothetical protein
MLALVAVDSGDLISILAAHIYTVCPTAIPTLPSPVPGASEDSLMESLGMLRDKDGQFETFDRFLHRTEVCDVFTFCHARCIHFMYSHHVNDRVLSQ